jgi:2,3,4,5-tetrahydropyridine-2-carboxylate N-succinyltransferase
MIDPRLDASLEALLDRMSAWFSAGVRDSTAAIEADFIAFRDALECGTIRAAWRDPAGAWHVETRVKQGILVGFRVGRIVEMDAGLPFSDRHTWPVQRPDMLERGQRYVPGGTSVRAGAYLGARVTLMPPAYVNVGAWVGDGTLIDSHALVGSCAQVGKDVHVSAAAQLGGVLEPVGMRPVIIEDGVLVGGNTGIYEGTLVRERAVIGAGVVLTASTPVYDLVRETIYRATAEAPLEIPAGAVVIAGSRPVQGSAFATAHGLQIQTPVIVKYRDERTDLRAALEGDLR